MTMTSCPALSPEAITGGMRECLMTFSQEIPGERG